MYEYIFPGLALDETKALAGVKPLHCSLFFAHFVILFSLIKLSGAPLPETTVFIHFMMNPGGSGRLQLRFFDPFELRVVKQTLKPCKRAQKKAASLTRDRFTTSKAIQEQQTQGQRSKG